MKARIRVRVSDCFRLRVMVRDRDRTCFGLKLGFGLWLIQMLELTFGLSFG